VTALGYGESQPLANNETAEGRRRNRRIDVVIYP
jgi:flagellar motor protein MotB